MTVLPRAVADARAGGSLAGSAAPQSAGSQPPAPALRANPPGFFHLAYCGSGRANDPESRLKDLDWGKAADGFDLTILQAVGAGYRDFIQSTSRRDPDHRFCYYYHAHGIYSYDDQAGVLNMIERNFVHGTDPASLRVVPVADGLLVDWDVDERQRYDEYDTISLMRDFQVYGYTVYRSTGDEPFELVWPRAADAPPVPLSVPDSVQPQGVIPRTEFIDRNVVAGKNYRYVVRTHGPLSREYPYSGEVAAIAGQPPVEPHVHDHQSMIEGAPGDSSYTGRFRVRVSGEGSRAWLLVDRNADHEFSGPDERIAMQPSHEDFVEAIIQLDPKSHSELDQKVKLGFGYRIEVEGESGSKIVLPSTGTYTTSVNNRVRDARWGFYLARTDTPFLIEHTMRQVDFVGARATGRVKSLFLDELLFDPSLGVDALPADLTAEAALADAVTLVKAIHTQRPDIAIYYNGLMAGEGLAGDGSPVDTLIAAGAAGGMIEGFAAAPWVDPAGGKRSATLVPAEEWRSQIAVARREVGRGRRGSLLLLARGTDLTDTRARIFALASYLLVRAPGVQFGYMVDRCTSPPLPEWGADLGEPEEPIPAIVAGAGEQAYGRRFERGEVWVNPGDRGSEVVKLASPGYRLVLENDPEGVGKVRWEWVDRLELGPQSAAIVVRPAQPAAAGPFQG